MPLTDFTPSTLIQSAQVDANFALCVLTDTARTIGVKHTISTQNPLAFTHADWVDGALAYTTSDNLTALALGTGRQLLQVNAGATAPQWTSNVDVPGTLDVTGATTLDSTLAAGGTTVTTLTAAGAATLQSTLAVTGAVTLTVALTTANGGTGLASYTAGDMVYYAASTLFTKLAIGAANRILTSSGTAPQWSENIAVGGTLGVTGATSVAALTATGVATFSADVVAAVIRRATSDTADTGSVSIFGGGATGTTRGGTIVVAGNEHASAGGIILTAGGVTGSISLVCPPAGPVLIQSGTGHIAVLDTATVRDTALMVYDVDNATLERVSVGTADSGGAGFKLLRIPN